MQTKCTFTNLKHYTFWKYNFKKQNQQQNSRRSMVQADKTEFVQPVEAMNIFVTGLFTTKSYKEEIIQELFKQVSNFSTNIFQC